MDSFRLSPHSCEHCKNIEIDGTGPEVKQRFEYTLHDVKAFAQYCALFQWILQCLDKSLDAADKLTLSISADSEDLTYLNIDWKDRYGLSVSNGDTEHSRLYIFAKKGNKAATYIRSRPLTKTRAGPANLKRCLEYYKSCLKHKACKKACKASIRGNKGDKVPTRLLHIGPKSQVRLYTVPEGEHPSYVALSYRWGETQLQENAKTKEANVQDRHHGIEESQLPQSIRDAVEVVQSCGLSYLWVDALCIVQDNREDVESEMSKMAGIYLGSTFAIAAASAKDSTEGFLGDRNLAEAYGRVFQLPYYHKRGDDVARGSVLLSEQPIYDTYQEPIDERAWTLQEDILPLRLIRFGSKQTTWRCLKHYPAINMDGGGRPFIPNEHLDFSVNNPHRVTEVQSNMVTDGSLGHSIVKASWLQNVSKYSDRKLTDQRDKLPGCAALAENFANIMGLEASQYLAGLWKIDIQVQLLWYRPAGTESSRCPNPSWSWASINGPVLFFECHLGDGFDIKAEYVDCVIEHESQENKYSKVKKGRLTLKGRLQQAYWDSVSLRGRTKYHDIIPFEIHWDLSESIHPQTVWCFEIIGHPFSLGLVLMKKDQSDFERVGFFAHRNREDSVLVRSWFDRAKPRTITVF